MREINQNGSKTLYVENNSGRIYIVETNRYISPDDKALKDGSIELKMFTPSINPPVERNEVNTILDWIIRDADNKNPQRVGLLYGKAGIGKSVVMNNLLIRLQEHNDFMVLGLKSDQIEFVDIDDLSHKLRLAQPLDNVILELANKYQRVILLIDQIDALSLSLSSNRTPLRSMMKLIQQIRNIPHVRVIVSCRPFDLEYDPILSGLKINYKWELKEFSQNEVKHILETHGITIKINDNTLHFLGTPLHLHLFLKLQQSKALCFPLSEETLYDQLWQLYICSPITDKISKANLLALLDEMIIHMYTRQELSVHISILYTNFTDEINYLLSNEILIKAPNDHLLFFHQTMFDYVLARRFVETNRDLLTELKLNHQGLFIRPAVKSILGFLRSTDPILYKKTILHLLNDRQTDGTHCFRFHIRSLALTYMAYFDEPIKEELYIIQQVLLYDCDHLIVLIDAIHNVAWFKAFKSILYSNSGWTNVNERVKEKFISAGRRILPIDPDFIIDFALELLDHGGDEEKNHVKNMFLFANYKASGDKLIKIYDRITSTRNPLENQQILKILVENNPEFVMDTLKENISIQISELKHKSLINLDIDFHTEQIYDELEKKHPELMIGFYLDILKIIFLDRSVLIDTLGHEIKFSFVSFDREKGHTWLNGFANAIINRVLDKIEDDIETGHNYHEKLLKDLTHDTIDIMVFIGLYGYTQNPQQYKDSILSILTERKILANAPVWVEYQAAELLRSTYLFLTRGQKNVIIDYILKIVDNGESIIDKNPDNDHLTREYPIYKIDRRKGVLLNLLPEDDLMVNYRNAYKELSRIKRKFKNDSLENTKPYSQSCQIGWPTMKEESVDKMDKKSWIKSMLSYNSDTHSDFNTPSRTGHAMKFRDQVKKNPEKMSSIIFEAISNSQISMIYPIYGLMGMLESGREDLAEKVFSGIVNEIGDDINTHVRDFDIWTLLLAVDRFIKCKTLPQTVFDFLCRAVMEIKENLPHRDDNDPDFYNTCINLPRGNAGYDLVACFKFPQYSEAIFTTLESIASSASEFTRGAVLMNFAVLNTLDKDRSLRLFLALMHDYHPKLMSLPVHNLNPLVYYVNYAFNDLIPFFEKALETESCYEQQVVILWLAWSHTHNNNAKEFLDSMCDRSETARITLIKTLSVHCKDIDKESSAYICSLMRDDYYSEKFVSQCDYLFLDLDSADKDIQKLISSQFVDFIKKESEIHVFYEFLAHLAIIDPIETLLLLEQSLIKHEPTEYNDWNNITDIIIQAYNGIVRYDDDRYKSILEKAMDMLDFLMIKAEHNYIIDEFINKLDNE